MPEAGPDLEAGVALAGRAGVLRRGLLAGSVAAAALALSACGGTVQASPGPANEVTGFGAKGDGRTDDTTAVQRAIAAASTHGGQVTFPPGRYVIRKTLTATAPIRLSGVAGQGGSILEFASSLPICLSLGHTGSKPSYPGARIEVAGLGLYYGGTGTVLSLYQSAWQDILVERCVFYVSGGGTGVQGLNARSLIVSNCSFFGKNRRGVGVQLNDSDNSHVISNTFYQLEYGVQGVRGPQRVFDAGCLLIGNDLYGAVHGLHFTYWELVQAVGNVIDGCDIPMQLNDCYHSIIDSNYLGGTGAGPVLHLYTTNGSLGENIVRSNFLNNYGTSKGGHSSVHFEGADPSLPVQYLTFAGNVVSGYPEYGIYLKNTNHSVIRENQLVQGGSAGVAIYDATPGQAWIEANDVPQSGITAQGDMVANNRGYVTEDVGTATLQAGQTSVHVSTPLRMTPTWVTVTPGGGVGGVWVTGISGAGFDVHVERAPASAVPLIWHAGV